MNRIFLVSVTFFYLASCVVNNINYYQFSTEIEQNIKNNSKNQGISTYAQDYSNIPTVDRIKKALEIFKLTPPELNYKELFNEHQIINAVDHIIELSSNEQIIILNEAHHYAYHRKFAQDLLIGLQKNGYKYLGVETITIHNNIKGDYGKFEQPKFITKNLGYYSNEPTFANFLREAIELGFILFPYEELSSDGKEREIGQAKNIKEFIDSHPDGKTFIYCGYSHNFEGNMKLWEKSMAGRLKEYLGIDPLTIDQTYFNHINSESTAPFLLRDTNINKEFQADSSRDLFVFHPDYKTNDKKISWKKSNNNDWLKISFDKNEVDFPVIVKVYINKEQQKAEAVPYDITEICAPNDYNWLVVPKTNYYIETRDINSKTHFYSKNEFFKKLSP
jgi:hypothetical protein